MPIRPAPEWMQPHEVPPARKYVLLVSCVDFRLLDDLVRFMDQENLTNRYYHVTFAGTSLGFSDLLKKKKKKAKCGLDCDSWERMLRDHLLGTVLLTKNQISDIYVMEHRECGAYREFADRDFGDDDDSQHDEADLHRKCARQFAEKLRVWMAELWECGEIRDKVAECPTIWKYKEPEIRSFLMDLRGRVERL